LDHVPKGSLLLHQEPTFWQLHRTLALSVAFFMALESALVAVLLIQRTRRKRAEALLADRNARLQASELSLHQLSGQLIGAQEEERKRIARELHDDLNQQVADLAISLSNIKRGLPPSLENAREELLSVQTRLLTLSDGIRHISHELHPGMLELFGLVAALKSHCREFGEVTSIPVEFEAGFNEPVAPDVALCVYRVAQEALRNAAKHSHARTAKVSLTKSGNLLELMVSDDGVGFDVSNALTRGGLGLRSMEERVRLVHGTIRLASQPDHGTALRVTVELDSSHDSTAPLRTMAAES
jgi:signal transduction histidine kinase